MTRVGESLGLGIEEFPTGLDLGQRERGTRMLLLNGAVIEIEIEMMLEELIEALVTVSNAIEIEVGVELEAVAEEGEEVLPGDTVQPTLDGAGQVTEGPSERMIGRSLHIKRFYSSQTTHLRWHTMFIDFVHARTLGTGIEAEGGANEAETAVIVSQIGDQLAGEWVE